jgi:hypothetical protein
VLIIKKSINILILSLAVFLAVLLLFTPVHAANETADPTSAKVIVDGVKVDFSAYNINNENYFKLRDLAFSLNFSSKQFSIDYDGTKDAIILTSGKSYTPVGGEMDNKKSGTKKLSAVSSMLILDGKRMDMTAYRIDGSNYYKLRDIAKIFDFGVDWDGTANTITISTSDAYKAPPVQSKSLKFKPLEYNKMQKENDKLIERAKNDPSFEGYGYQDFFGVLAVWDSKMGMYFYQNNPRYYNSAWYASEGHMGAVFDSIEFTMTDDGKQKVIQKGTYSKFIDYDIDPESGPITLTWVKNGTIDGLPYFEVEGDYYSPSGSNIFWQNPVVFRVRDKFEDLKFSDWDRNPKGELLDLLLDNNWYNNGVSIGTQAQYRFYGDGRYVKYSGADYLNRYEGYYILDDDKLLFQNGTEMRFNSNENAFVSTTIGYWMVDNDYYRLYPSKNR